MTTPVNIVDQAYWDKLEPFKIGVSECTSEINKKRYLLRNTETEKFDVKDTVKRFEHLLSLSHLFKHFIENKAQKNENFRQVLDVLKGKGGNNLKRSNSHHDMRRRKSEREEDAELLRVEEIDGENGNEEDEIEFQFRESPEFINGTLRDYQIQGLNWLVSLHKSRLAGILADEMGLGKTLQTISFLGYLRYIEKKRGPFLVIAPKSTLNNWLREFNKWTPEVNAFILQGDKDERLQLIQDKLLPCEFDVVIASYEIIIREKASFRKIDWEYILIDEAHRIKNEESLLSQVLREFTSRNRLLITGTPLQNNLHELWALLNFLLPDIFSDSQDFDDWFSAETTEEDQEKVVKQLHTVLQPFLLRRIKNDVETSLLPKKELNLYVGMSTMQKNWYRKILEKDLDAVNGVNGNKESKTRLLNIVMQLRKCCNHPYLFDGAEPGPPYTTDEHLIYNSEKLKVLDKLLTKLRQNGSRVLIFSQMSRVLDILEDYCYFRGYEYCRIDGSTDHELRIQAIDEYNAPDSKKFIFLLTTRAGGLGINLTTADTVVLYDSDWNPQADLQAMDRAHRIGQKKQVKVFRMVTDNSVEEKILERATQKLRLDQLVIQQNKTSYGNNKKKEGESSKDALLSMIQYGAADLFSQNESGSVTPDLTSNDNDDQKKAKEDFDLDALLVKSENKTKTLNAKYETLGLDDLQKFNQDSAYEWNGTDFKKQQGQKDVIPMNWVHSGRRERTTNYSVDGYYKDVLNTNGRGGSMTPGHSRLPRGHLYFSHHLQPPQLKLIYEKERMWMAHKIKYEATMEDVKTMFNDSYQEGEEHNESNQQLLSLLQLMINNAQPLSEEEEALKTKLEQEGYPNWTKNELRKFVSSCANHGRRSIQQIAADLVPGKTIEEVRSFAKSFWSQLEYVEDFEKYIRFIDTEEERLKSTKLQQECLRRKLSLYTNPMKELTLKYPPNVKPTPSTFSMEEDRFILLMLFKYGLDRSDVYDLIRDEFRRSPLFSINYSIKIKKSYDFAKRGAQLLNILEKEFHNGIVMTDELKKRLEEEDKFGKRTREEYLEKEEQQLVNDAEDDIKKIKTE